MLRLVRFSIILLLTAAPASAEPQRLLLGKAVRLAVRGNPTLGAANAQVGEATARVHEARGLDDTRLSARASVDRSRRARVPGNPVQAVGVDGLQGRLSLIQPLAIGGQLGLHLEGGYRRTEFATESRALGLSAAEQFTPAVSLSVEQPLLRGMGVDIARASRFQAQAQHRVAEAQRQQLALSVVRDVVSGYWALAYAQRQVDIQGQLVAAAEGQLERVRETVAVGKLPASATAEIEVALALRKDASLSAQVILAQQELALRRLCGVERGSPLVASQSLPEVDESVRRSRHEALNLALSNTPNLEAARWQTRAAAVALKAAHNQRLPQLDLSVSGGPLANAPSLSDASEQLIRFSGYAAMAQLTFDLPLQGRAAEGASAAARAALKRSEFGETDTRAQLEQAVASAVARQDMALHRARLLAPAHQAAERDLASEMARFEAGRGSSFDVLRRQEALAAMQLRVLAARLDWNQALTALQSLTGELLTHHGVVLGASKAR